MSNYPPPTPCPGTPLIVDLPAGTEGSRIHRDAFKPDQFNFTRSDDPYRGGRFDSHRGDYGYLYIASDDDGAVDETLLRDAPHLDTGHRIVPKTAAEGRDLSRLVAMSTLPVVDLYSQDGLAQVGQTNWLTDSDSHFYPQTRVWADAIRRWCRTAAGFLYRPRHNHDEKAWVLFADTAAGSTRPTAAGTLTTLSRETIASGPGRARVEAVLRRRLASFGP